MAEELVVNIAEDEELEKVSKLGVIGVIWSELNGGIGPWGTLRPLFSIILALIPFLFLGQHFNRQHEKANSWFLIQLPLLFTVILWFLLFVWSIGDAFFVSSRIVAKAENEY
jgi:phosphoglycerol transferase MdoB-like AlkP superfamily enzyme